MWDLRETKYPCENPTAYINSVHFSSKFWEKKHEDKTDVWNSVDLKCSRLNTTISGSPSPQQLGRPITWFRVQRLKVIENNVGRRRRTTKFAINSTESNNKKNRRIVHPTDILAWITTGKDGKVIAEEIEDVNYTQANGETISGLKFDKSLNNKRVPWTVNFDAHSNNQITDADVDPMCKWLITCSLDGLVKIHYLKSGSTVFVTNSYRNCVRTVAFRPVVYTKDEFHQIHFAAGYDDGMLRIWQIGSSELQTDTIHKSTINSPIKTSKSPAGRSRTNVTSTMAVRATSPDSVQTNLLSHAYKTREPVYHSSTAGTRRAWLVRLQWNSDGSLLSGLSDRLCVWPFTEKSLNKKLKNVTRPLSLGKCRVLRVLSTGANQLGNLTRNLLNIGPSSESSLSTIITVDTNTGTLYIFDPIEQSV